MGLIDKGYSGKGLSLISVLGQAESPVRPEDRSHIYRMDYLSHPLSLSVEYLKVLLFLARSMSRQPVGTKSRIIKTCGTAREGVQFASRSESVGERLRESLASFPILASDRPKAFAVRAKPPAPLAGASDSARVVGGVHRIKEGAPRL